MFSDYEGLNYNSCQKQKNSQKIPPNLNIKHTLLDNIWVNRKLKGILENIFSGMKIK